MCEERGRLSLLMLSKFRGLITGHRTQVFVVVFGYGIIAMLNSAVTHAPFLGTLCGIFFPMTALSSAGAFLAYSALLFVAVLEGDWPGVKFALRNAALCAASYSAFAIASGWTDKIHV